MTTLSMGTVAMYMYGARVWCLDIQAAYNRG